MMDRKERKAGDPFGGAPMKQFEGSQLPEPPKIDEVVAELEEVLEEQDMAETQEEARCPCGYKMEHCKLMHGIPILIEMYLADHPEER